MSIINDNINYLYNVLRNDFNYLILNNTKNTLISNIYYNISISLLLDFYKFIRSLSFKYYFLAFHSNLFSVSSNELKKNHLKTVILIRSFIEENEVLQEQLLKFIFQPVLEFSKKMNRLKFIIYFPFYIYQEKTNYHLKFRNCSNRVLLTISKSNLYKVLNND